MIGLHRYAINANGAMFFLSRTVLCMLNLNDFDLVNYVFITNTTFIYFLNVFNWMHFMNGRLQAHSQKFVKRG